MTEKLISILDPQGDIERIIDCINKLEPQKNNEGNLYKKIFIVMLCTKFECFLENITSKWFEKLKNDSLLCYNLPEVVKQEIIKDSIEKVYDDLKNGKISTQNKSKLNNFKLLINEFIPLSELDVDFKIRMGSHGSKEVEKLLKKIGISDIFDKIKDDINIEVEQISIKTSFDYRGVIDKMIKYRNNILHEDRLDLITIQDLDVFIKTVNKVCTYVSNYIDIENKHIERSKINEIKV